MKLRTSEPWMPAPDYSRSLRGLTIKPHGLREAYLLDADGYLWVPDGSRPRDDARDTRDEPHLRSSAE